MVIGIKTPEITDDDKGAWVAQGLLDIRVAVAPLRCATLTVCSKESFSFIIVTMSQHGSLTTPRRG